MKYLLVNGLFSDALSGVQHEFRWHFLKALEAQALSLGAELVLINETLKYLNSTNAILLTSLASKNPLFIANTKEVTSEHVDLMKTLGCLRAPNNMAWDDDTNSTEAIILHYDKITKKNKNICYIDVTKHLSSVFRVDGLHTMLVDTESKKITEQLLNLEALDLTVMPILNKETDVPLSQFSLERESLFSSLLKKNQDMLKENSVKDDEDEIISTIDQLQGSGEFSEHTGDYLKNLLQDSLTLPAI
jgi:hypothetical protein